MVHFKGRIGKPLMPMEESLLQILSRYISSMAAENLLRRALSPKAPATPGEWARFIEGSLWPELGRLLPFREMPPELKALVRELKQLSLQEAEGESEEPEEEEALLEEAVDLEDPAAREHLARRLARLEGVLGVVVAGGSGKEERFAGEPIPLELIHLLLARQGYGVFYALLQENVVALKPVGAGYVGLLARKETNIGRLLHALRRLVPITEVTG
ncbi:hypothetical protein Thermus77420_09510 [Thermus thalpophilus]